MPLVDHADLVVSSIERSLPFYRGLLAPLGWIAVARQEGERGEPIHYLGGLDLNGSLGLREAESPAEVDRYRSACTTSRSRLRSGEPWTRLRVGRAPTVP